HDLPALARADGHRLDGQRQEGGATLFRLTRGPLAPVARAAPPAPDRAPADSGFALREAVHEGGAPEVRFDLDGRDQVWVDEARALSEQALGAQWSVERDLDWSPPRAPLAPDLDWAVAQVMSFLAENEVSALLVPAAFVRRIHPHFVEVSQFLASRI